MKCTFIFQQINLLGLISAYRMHGFWELIVIQPGPSFTHQRKLFNKVFGAKSMRDHDALIRNEVGPFLEGLSTVAGDPFHVILRLVASSYLVLVTPIVHAEFLAQSSSKLLMERKYIKNMAIN